MAAAVGRAAREMFAGSDADCPIAELVKGSLTQVMYLDPVDLGADDPTLE